MDNTGYTPEEPIAAIATALAPSALGIVRASGKNTIELFSKIFSRPKALLNAQGNTIVYGWILDELKNENGKLKNESDELKNNRIDEVLVSVFKAPKSFTGEDMIEISCHGGVSVVTAVFNLLLKNGFRQAEKGEFTFRAYINGKADLTKAEAVREIIDSKTDVSRSHAAGRLAGNLYETIDSVKKLIVETIADIEVEIEYPEDEENIADSFDDTKLKNAEKALQDLASSWKSEKIYQDGARVVLCGKTNAGKSSLFNALLKEDRAIVSDIEGTTRDFIESWIDFDGIPARLFDTAGLRETDDVIEAKGVEITRDLSKEADLVLYLVDSTVGITEDDAQFLNEKLGTEGIDFSDSEKLSNTKVPVIIVYTKSDKGLGDRNEASGSSGSQISISSKTGEGISELCSTIKNLLTKSSESDRNRAGLGSERQKVAVEEALESVRHALSLTNDFALDAVVQDLEDSLDSLGTVTGEVTPDDILGSIFSRFCVGK